jgi:hypothetical protein
VLLPYAEFVEMIAMLADIVMPAFVFERRPPRYELVLGLPERRGPVGVISAPDVAVFSDPGMNGQLELIFFNQAIGGACRRGGGRER